MRDESIPATIWRRRKLVLVAIVGAVAAAALVSTSLDKVYTTSSKLLIVQTQEAQSFDSIQAAQVTARTYSDVLSSPNMAALVAKSLGDGTSADAVRSAVDVSPIAETQLLEVEADASTPTRAKRLADVYAREFVGFAKTSLEPTTEARVALADAAPLPASPSRPKPLLYALVALALAVPLAIGLALAADRLDQRIRTPDELEADYGLTVLARVPRRRRREQARLAFDEAFRVLRVAYQFAVPGDERGRRMLAVTSAGEGEGKTTTSLELARAVAETGRRVLLVEADTRHADLTARILEGAKGHGLPGLTHYLLDEADLDDVIAPTASPLIGLIPGGTTQVSVSGMLESRRGQRLTEQLAERADLVIFDCPPVTAGADAAAVAALARHVLFVIDLRLSTRRRLRECLRKLETVNTRVAGCVVNRDRTLRPVDYGYRYLPARAPEVKEEPRVEHSA